MTNPFIPADLRTVLASRPNPTAAFSWNARYVGVPYKNWDESYQVQQYLAGPQGDITEGWTFDVFASYDESVHDQTMHEAVLKTPGAAAAERAGRRRLAVRGRLQSVWRRQCALAFAAVRELHHQEGVQQGDLDQTQVQGQVNGRLFDLGAGPVQVALLADWRENTYRFSPDTDLCHPERSTSSCPPAPAATSRPW